MLTTEVLRQVVRRLAAAVEAGADELNAADAALGDGDLGVTMVRGMRSVAEQADALPPDLGAALLQCARAFVSISGSTFGTLLATGAMSAAKTLQGRTEVGWQEAPALLEAAMEAIARRGKAAPGHKTVLDAIAATIEGLRAAAAPEEMIPAAIEFTQRSLDAFRDQPAQQGRARMFGENSRGRDDPGMVAWLSLLQALRR